VIAGPRIVATHSATSVLVATESSYAYTDDMTSADWCDPVSVIALYAIICIYLIFNHKYKICIYILYLTQTIYSTCSIKGHAVA
jgi:hypothetical protein